VKSFYHIAIPLTFPRIRRMHSPLPHYSVIIESRCAHQSREISGNTIADAKHVHPLSDNVFPHSKVVRLSKGCLIAMRAGNMNDDIFLPNTVICFEIIIDITEIIVNHVNKYQQ